MPRLTLSLRVSIEYRFAVVGGSSASFWRTRNTPGCWCQVRAACRRRPEAPGCHRSRRQHSPGWSGSWPSRSSRTSFRCRRACRSNFADSASAHVRGGKVAAGDDIAELAHGLGGFGWRRWRKDGRSENGVDLGLGVQHRRACRGDESALCRTKRVILLVVEGGDIEPLAGGEARLWAASLTSMVLVERVDDPLVGTEASTISRLPPGAAVRHLLPASGRAVERVLVLAASSDGPATARPALSAEIGRLAERCGMSRPLRSIMRTPSCCST